MRKIDGILLAALSAILAIASLGWADEETRENVARGKSYELRPAPNYYLTLKGDTDSTDLTDGYLSTRDKIWFEPKAVGWEGRVGIAQIKLDLGEVYPIEEVAIRLQGGYGSMVLPDHVEVLVSDDDETYYLANDYRFWRPGDRERFALPPEIGTPFVCNLRLRDMKTRARYVGLRIRGGGIFSDEVAVFKGEHDPDQVKFAPADVRLFTTKVPYVYPLREKVHVCRDFLSPCRFGIVLSSPDPTKIRFFLDVPAGVTIADLPDTGIYGGDPPARLRDAEQIPLDDGGTRYILATSVSSKSAFMRSRGKDFAHFQMTTDWPAGKTGELRYGMQVQGGEDYEAAVPLEAVSIGPVPCSDRLRTLIGAFWGWKMTQRWPGFLDMCDRMGFTAVAAFLSDADKEEALDFFEAARRRGYEIVAFTGDPMGFYHTNEESHCETAPGEYAPGRNAPCPSYRGKHFQEEMKRMVRRTLRRKPDVETWDIEIWNWQGPLFCEKCLRCKADFEESGAESWQEWRSQKGVELLGDFINPMKAACAEAGVKMPEIGVYDFVAGTWYQKFWDVSRLNEVYGINSEPSTYSPVHPANIERMGDEVRRTQLQMGPEGKVIPWMSPGDYGLFSSEQMRWALLDYFANGAPGVYFYSHRYWDTDYLMGMAGALKMVYPVQHIVADGSPLPDIAATEGVRVRGVGLGDEMFIMVADYRLSKPRTAEVLVPVLVGCDVIDLETGQTVAQVNDEYNLLRVELSPERRQRVYYVKPTQ